MQIKLRPLSMSEARSRIATIDTLDDVAFKDLVDRWSTYNVDETTYDPSYKEFRAELVDCFKSALQESGGKMSYTLDLRMGIKIYELLNPRTGFTNVQANDDDIWRYISVCVMPDITYLRYPKPEQGSLRINQKRFYSHTRRIWLKTLWWYVHLGWQGTSEKTFDVLKNNGTNIISHFIERPGKGYRPKLFRSMMYVYSTLPTQKDTIFRAAAKMNLAKCVTVEPALTVGGEDAYTAELFREIVQEGTSENVD
jgi:hypothetical protein